MQEEKSNRIFPAKINNFSIKIVLKKIRFRLLLAASSYYHENELNLISENLKGLKKLIYSFASKRKKKKNHKIGYAKQCAAKIESMVEKLIKRDEVTLLPGEANTYSSFGNFEPSLSKNNPLSIEDLDTRAKNKTDPFAETENSFRVNPQSPESVKIFLKKTHALTDFRFNPAAFASIILELAHVANKHGNQSLKKLMEDCPNEILKQGISLIHEGSNRMSLQRVLLAKKKRALFEFEMMLDMVIESLISIQSGDQVENLQEKIRAFF